MSLPPARSLPTGWKLKRFGDCATFINGRAYAQDELLESGTPVLRIQNLNGGDRWYYSNLQLPEDKYCEPGDLLFAWSASFGPYIWSGQRSIYHYHIWRILPHEQLDKRFAYYLLAFVSRELKSQARGIAMLHLTKSGIEALEIALPPLGEQRRIAAVLDAADELRNKRRATIERCEALSQAIFAEMFNKALSNLDRVSLTNLVEEFRYGTSNKSAPYGYTALRIPNVIGGGIDLSELKTVPVEQPELDRLRLQVGDLLFVRTNGNPDYVGRCAVFDPIEIEKRGHDPSDWIFASYLIRARVKLDRVNPIFIRELLSTGEGRKALRERSKTSAGQFNINTEGLGSIPIPLPPIEQQNAFARRVASVEPVKKYYESSLAKLEALFVSLQDRAFKGEL